MIRSSLRKRRLLVGENDLKDTLARRSPVEATTFLIESGLARRAALVQCSPAVLCFKNDQEMVLSRSMRWVLGITGKRARQDNEAPELAETSPKRRVKYKNTKISVLPDMFVDSGFCEILANETPPNFNRSVEDSLCLVEVGQQRKGRLDDQLSRCIGVFLADLADAPDVKAGSGTSPISQAPTFTTSPSRLAMVTRKSRDSASGEGVTRNPARLDQHRVRQPRSTFGSPSMGGGAAWTPKAPEEEAYWIASDVCKETLRKARIARNEVKWLAHQADVVNEAADRMIASLRTEFQRQEEKVEKVGGDMQSLSGEVEELTRGLVDEHVASSQSKEESLLSFLDTLNGEDGVGDMKVRKRARVIALHEAARLSHRRESARRLLASHAVKIGEVMCHELYMSDAVSVDM